MACSDNYNYLVPIVRVTEECNLACPYCYVFGAKQSTMNHRTLKRIIEQTTGVYDYVKFLWHGGEPLMAGLDFFKKIIEIQKPIKDDTRIQNTVQTNGLLLNRKILEFFKENEFRVGVSINGPKQIHNADRILPDGSGTHSAVMKKIKIMREMGMYIKGLAILTRKGLNHITEIYDFFSKEQMDFGINPVVEQNPQQQITGEEYGVAMIQLYEHIMDIDEGIECEVIEEYRNAVKEGETRTCLQRKDCYKNFAGFDPEGNMYNCNRFASHRDWALGNINRKPLKDIMSSQKYLSLERDPNKIGCNKCYWKNICNGGCGYEAFLSYGTLQARTPFCEGRKMIFEHIAAREGAILNEPLPF